MESLAHLVTESLARHNFATTVDHRRLQWSKWFRCEDSFSSLLVPSQPGLFALGEEIIAPGEAPITSEKRMLALFQVTASEDLGMALGRLFLPGGLHRERLAGGRCFVRYAVIEDAHLRQSALAALQQWMTASAETASGVVEFESRPFAWGTSQTAVTQSGNAAPLVEPPDPLPSGF